MTIIWYMVPDISHATNRFSYHFGLIFVLLPPYNSKNQNFENLKKNPEDIIILHMCAINNNHMMYDSWEIVHDGQIFLSFWMIFCPLTPLTTPKIKSLKNWKKHQEILPFCQLFFFFFIFFLFVLSP